MVAKRQIVPCLDRVRGLLSYDPVTGQFAWRVTRNSAAMAGSAAGYIERYRGGSASRRRIRLDGRAWMASSLAWYLHFGEWPHLLVDHIDGDTLNDKISNLRLATPSQNAHNRPSPKTKRVPCPKGVFFRSKAKSAPWAAAITINGIREHLGFFASKEEAGAAYQAASLRQGEFALRLGRRA